MSDESQLRVQTNVRQAHPWHGVDPLATEGLLTVFIENVQFDVMKYETERGSGLLKIDHPLQTSALPPYAYGFVPRTLCGARVARMASGSRGDRAPLDVFVLTERPVSVPGVLAEIRLLGGIPTRDETRIDDKLIGALNRDATLSDVEDIGSVPIYMLDRISHFLSQSSLDGSTEIGDPFGLERAQRLLQAAMDDYQEAYPA